MQKYVTEFTSAGNAADAIKNCVQSTKAFERCEATARRVNHEVIHKLPGIKLQ